MVARAARRCEMPQVRLSYGPPRGLTFPRRLKFPAPRADNRRMEVFEALDAQWSPLLLVCGIPLVVAGVILRSVSKRRGFSWRLGDAALGLGVTFLAIAAILHIVLPLVGAKLSEMLQAAG